VKTYDPAKFSMEIARGVKAEARADAPDIAVPFCKEHRTWPCRYCGTSHFEGCTCPVCVEPKPDPLRAERATAREWAEKLEEMARQLRRFADGEV
jgi:hypothetical protein